MVEKLELEVDELLLDLQNPRFRHDVSTQAEALEEIIKLDTSYFKTMMRSIRDHGLDPGDSFYVLQSEEEEGAYVVVDGNRRLAALKVLYDPTILAGTSLGPNAAKQIAKAGEGFKAARTKNFSAVLFDDRDQANEWILRRHGRSMDGEGRIGWGPLEIDRFKRERTILDVIDFVERNSEFDDDTWKRIRHAVENAPNVLKRVLISKAGKEWLGLSTLSVDGSTVPLFDRPPEFVNAVLSKVFSDIADEVINTRSLNKADEVQAYFDDLPRALHPSGKSTKGKPQKFADAVVPTASERPRQKKAEGAAKIKKDKTSKASPPRVTLAPSRHLFAIPSTAKGQELLREAAKVRLRDFPLASAYLLRAFLEHTIDSYMTSEGMPFFEKNKQLELKVRADRVVQHLVQNKKALMKDLKGVNRTLTSPSDPASIQALNDYHHDRYQVPAVDVLRNAWDSAVPLFIAVYGAA